MAPRIRYFTIFPLVWVASWALVAGVSLDVQPFVAVDWQYPLALAWTLWRDGGFLQTGIDQDGALVMWPLLVWVIDLGWFLFGVSDWWPRLAGYGAGLFSVFLTAGLARLLWPGRVGLGALSGTALSASMVWLVLAGTLGPYALATALAMGAVYALVWHWRTGRRDGCLYYGVLTGGCVLTIGPAGWLVCIPPALLAPLWASGLADQIDDRRKPPHGWRHWYTGCAMAFMVSVAVFLVWAGTGLLQVSPDLLSLAEAALVFISSMGSVVPSVAPAAIPGEGHSVWWLLLVAGIAVMPWVFWVPAWQSMTNLKQVVLDGGARLCVLWSLIVVVPVAVFTTLEPWLLCVALPPLHLVLAFLLFHQARKEADKGADRETPQTGGYGPLENEANAGSKANGEAAWGLMLAMTGAALLVAPFAGSVFEVPPWLAKINGGWGGLLMALGALVASARPPLLDLRMMVLSVVSALVVALGILATGTLSRDYTDPHPAADFVAEQWAQGVQVAFVGNDATGDYAGQFDFPVRAEKKIIRLSGHTPLDRTAWIAANPGAVIAQIREAAPASTQSQQSLQTPQPLQPLHPLAIFPYGSRYMVFWLSDMIAANPSLLESLPDKSNIPAKKSG